MEELIKKMKRMTTAQLLVKANKAKDEEKEAINRVLMQRGILKDVTATSNEDHHQISERTVYSEVPSILTPDEEFQLKRAEEDDLTIKLRAQKDIQSNQVKTIKEKVVKEKREKVIKEKKEKSTSGESTNSLVRYVDQYKDKVLSREEIQNLKTKREKVIACWFSNIREVTEISEIANYAKPNVKGIIYLAKLKNV